MEKLVPMPVAGKMKSAQIPPARECHDADARKGLVEQGGRRAAQSPHKQEHSRQGDTELNGDEILRAETGPEGK
jgi:hypothetical protein